MMAEEGPEVVARPRFLSMDGTHLDDAALGESASKGYVQCQSPAGDVLPETDESHASVTIGIVNSSVNAMNWIA